MLTDYAKKLFNAGSHWTGGKDFLLLNDLGLSKNDSKNIVVTLEDVAKIHGSMTNKIIQEKTNGLMQFLHLEKYIVLKINANLQEIIRTSSHTVLSYHPAGAVPEEILSQ